MHERAVDGRFVGRGFLDFARNDTTMRPDPCSAVLVLRGNFREEEGLMIVEKVRELVSQHGRLSVPVTELADDSDLYNAGLTSLATVGLMLALEDGFDIEFPDAMLSRRTFGSIASLAAAVEELAGKPAPA
jgi:acyl carrier protein